MRRISLLVLLATFIAAQATDVALSGGMNPLVQPTPAGYHRIDCSQIIGLNKDELGRFAAKFLSRQNGLVEGIKKTNHTRNSCADTLIDVTFAYLDTDPEYNETVGLHVVDDQKPLLAFIPTQPANFPFMVQCAKHAIKIADEDIPAIYLKRFLTSGVTDACQKKPIARYAWEKVFGDNTNHNFGQIMIHWSGDDGCGNTDGVTQSIHFRDTNSPQFTQTALDTFKKLGVHARLCIYGAQQTPICPAKLVRDLALELTHDECDDRHPAFIHTRVSSFDYRKCKPRSTGSCELVDSSSGNSMLGKRGYDSGDFTQISVRVSDASGNAMKDPLQLEFRFASTRSACETYKNVPAFDAKQLTVPDTECHNLQNSL